MAQFSEIPDTSLVLVAILPNKRDLDIARMLGWYRIPLKTAPKVISVDYLAFYQTAAFNEKERWQIRWLAPILGHELTTRADLFRDEPEHRRANEEYFKLQLGSLIEVPDPIQAGDWKRVTFFYTTGERCKRAKKLTDLPVHDEERQILWRSLRERALRGQEYNANQLPEMAIDPSILAFLSGLNK
ncbi:MAG: hypothetical protein GX853_02560 [Chloroflexi bacterium]|nr:hypothetical protein [Chloroflexota bacterium]